ncbi:MAG: acyltransferase [Clostridiales bacterium]|nr:acyltransferase [Clostridiales bacterium]
MVKRSKSSEVHMRTMLELNPCNGENVKLLNNNFLNLVPLICALFVVLIHSYNVDISERNSVGAFIISFFLHGLCTAAVPTFFFVSGWLFYINADSIHVVIRKMKKRVFTVLLPFVAWSLIYYLFYLLGDFFIPQLNTDVDFSFLGVLRGIFFYEYVFPMWYMFQLCLFIIIAPIVFYILKNKFISSIVLLSTILIGMFICSSVDITVAGLERSIFQFNFFAYYFCGCWLSQLSNVTRKCKDYINKIPLFIPICLFVIFGFLQSLFFEGKIVSFNERCIVPFVFISFMVMMIKIYETKKKFLKINISTMIIYGVHPMVGLLLGKLVFNYINLPTIVSYVYSYILVSLISIGISYFIKKLKPIYYVLGGNR